jgi:hypothetical protein
VTDPKQIVLQNYFSRQILITREIIFELAYIPVTRRCRGRFHVRLLPFVKYSLTTQ